jgi:hypothetical protein
VTIRTVIPVYNCARIIRATDAKLLKGNGKQREAKERLKSSLANRHPLSWKQSISLLV